MHSKRLAASLSRPPRGAHPPPERAAWSGASARSLTAAALGLQRTVGNGATARVLGGALAQPRLTVNRPGDRREQEAGRVADEVMRMSEPEAANGPCPTCADRTKGDIARTVATRALGSNIQSREGGLVAGGQLASRIVGLEGAGRQLPRSERDFFESRFGADFSEVRIHRGSEAAMVAREVNARAFTYGRNIIFGHGEFLPNTEVGRHLLAHELSHVVQNSRQGTSATVAQSVQRYTLYEGEEQRTGAPNGWIHPQGADLRVSDDGLMAAEDRGWGNNRSKRAWTTQEKIDESNRILAAQESRVELIRKRSHGRRLTGLAPETGEARTLLEIEPVERGSGGRGVGGALIGGAAGAVLGGLAGGLIGGLAAGGGGLGIGLGVLAGAVLLGALFASIGHDAGERKKDLSLYPDCGTACRLVMGSGEEDVAVFDRPAEGGEPRRHQFSEAREYHGGFGSPHPSTPEEFSEDLLRREFGAHLPRSDLYARYAALTPTERDEFDRKYGINKYAVPQVGQGQTIATEPDRPGFAIHPGMERDTWNFHYAATVLRSGHDHITLESAAGWSPKGWIFFMYGPPSKPGQTFHEFHGATRTHGTEFSTYVVQPSRLLNVETSRDNVTLRTATEELSLSRGTTLYIVERRFEEGGIVLVVQVLAGPHAGRQGRVAADDVRRSSEDNQDGS